MISPLPHMPLNPGHYILHVIKHMKVWGIQNVPSQKRLIQTIDISSIMMHVNLLI